MQKLGELLVSEGLVSPEELQTALDFQKERGGLLGTALVRLGSVTEDGIRGALARKYGIAVVDLAAVTSDPQAMARLPREKAAAYGAFPVALEGRRLTLAIADPTDVRALDDLRFASGCEVTPLLASATDILTAIETRYPAPAGDDPEPKVEVAELGDDETGRLLADLVATAIRRSATEIHLEPRPKGLEVRFRAGASRHNLPVAPGETRDAVATRLRKLCNLDESERRRSQSAELPLRVQVDGGERTILLLVSTLNTVQGERLVLELLHAGDRARDPSTLGLDAPGLSRLLSAIEATHGLVLITGPSRSGKTTTFYSLLSWLNRSDRFIVSAEDRIECAIDGVHQIALSDPAFQYDTLLAMKPDVISMKGLGAPGALEFALEAARGRIVLAETEAFDSASALYRVPPDARYWLSRTARFVTSQRLLPRLCPDCRESTERSREMDVALGWNPRELESLRLFRSPGCPSCSGSGYLGLTGIFEWIDVDESVRRALEDPLTTQTLRDMPPREGFFRLRQAALSKVSEGEVALRDVLSFVT